MRKSAFLGVSRRHRNRVLLTSHESVDDFERTTPVRVVLGEKIGDRQMRRERPERMRGGDHHVHVVLVGERLLELQKDGVIVAAHALNLHLLRVALGLAEVEGEFVAFLLHVGDLDGVLKTFWM